jgi:hypothetical protein
VKYKRLSSKEFYNSNATDIFNKYNALVDEANQVDRKLSNVITICKSYGINGNVNGIIGDPIILVNQILSSILVEAGVKESVGKKLADLKKLKRSEE